MLGDRLIVLIVGLIDVYLVFLGVGWALNGGGGIGLALAGFAGLMSFAAFRYALRGGG